ncbi:hypothetical protein GCM10022234_00300 [Aeromicrobium panaciterrae]|uniref:hypothetical protein n=1 Tax=Aeromicrobium panaciterrae TaxID=363861 RepID=UPI0031E0E9B3
MITRAERKARNKTAHAIRRALTDADYREAKTAGDALTWREVWETYAAIPVDTILRDYAAMAEPAPVKPERVKVKRSAPRHVQEVGEAYRLARETWEAGLADAMRGARANGKPARGEKYTDEERDYRAAHPAPVYRDFLTAYYADQRDLQGREVA